MTKEHVRLFFVHVSHKARWFSIFELALIEFEDLFLSANFLIFDNSSKTINLTAPVICFGAGTSLIKTAEGRGRLIVQGQVVVLVMVVLVHKCSFFIGLIRCKVPDIVEYIRTGFLLDLLVDKHASLGIFSFIPFFIPVNLPLTHPDSHNGFNWFIYGSSIYGLPDAATSISSIVPVLVNLLLIWICWVPVGTNCWHSSDNLNKIVFLFDDRRPLLFFEGCSVVYGLGSRCWSRRRFGCRGWLWRCWYCVIFLLGIVVDVIINGLNSCVHLGVIQALLGSLDGSGPR